MMVVGHGELKKRGGGDLLPPTRFERDMDEITKKKLEAIERTFLLEAEQIAAQVREKLVVPFCMENKLNFLSGNGSFCFVRPATSEYLDFEIKSDRLPNYNEITTELEYPIPLLNQMIGSYMEDFNYDHNYKAKGKV